MFNYQEYRQLENVLTKVAYGTASTDEQVVVRVGKLHFGVDRVQITDPEYQQRFKALLTTYPNLEELQEGPSYLDAGARLGGQDIALTIFIIGAAMELWQLITPQSFGITGEEANEMIGLGCIWISGYNAE